MKRMKDPVFFMQYIYSENLMGPFFSIHEAKVEIKRRKKAKKDFVLYHRTRSGLIEVELEE